MNARALAAKALEQVQQGRSLSHCLPPLLATLPPRDRPLAQALCYGGLRWRDEFDRWLALLLDRPNQRLPTIVRSLLHVGLYQLACLRLPDYAAVAETVNASRQLREPRAAGLINAVLRRYLRQPADFVLDETSHPAWWLAQFRQDWPDHWDAIARANNQQAPLWLRVNRRHGSRAAYLARLAANDIGVVAPVPTDLADAVLLAQPSDPTQLPEFAEGACSVQDAAAQWAAVLLAPRDGERVLDACAAPGGKSAHVLEQADIALTALDSDPQRLALVATNLARLGLTATVRCADAASLGDWWDGTPFDAILLDAPCSASGVIRRHPDIKYLRRADDIAVLAAQQRQLLTALWPTLRTGGRLLYATCSVLAAENTAVVAAFLGNEPTAHLQPMALSVGRPTPAGWQIFPSEGQADGFFYALLAKG